MNRELVSAKDLRRTAVPDGAPRRSPFAELRPWRGVLDRLGIARAEAARLAALARANGTTLQTELLASGLAGEDAHYRTLAGELGLAFLEAPDPERLILREGDHRTLLGGHGGNRFVFYREDDGPLSLLIVPDRLDLDVMRGWMATRPELARRLKVVSRSALRSMIMRRGRVHLGEAARNLLFDTLPECSARIVANAWQGALVGAVAVGLPVGVVLAPTATVIALHVFFSLFFLSCVGLRVAALSVADPPRLRRLAPVRAAELPVYTVLVALYKEAEIVPDLLVALGRIEWPRAKLEIKLVCEEDDHETLAALRAQALRPYVEIIEVPRIGPRTKPNALVYALPMCGGDYVVLFDAEDRPHPRQLIEAWQRFRSGDADLGCVQAPLVVSNPGESLVARMFAFEYAALFRGLLPFLSRHGLVLPLGGTSSHFPRRVIDEVCGWDPYNVTEDAELGLRLVRFGYRTETITHPTFEDAPADFTTWLPQRTRWFKGWFQTWLVHMRSPAQLAREIGMPQFLLVQILFAGMVLSALVHPLLVLALIFLSLDLLFALPLSTARSVLIAVDSLNIACGYAAFLLLGWATLTRHEKRGFLRVAIFTPVYWMMMSLAAWRAAWQLYRAPHLWEKTPHPRRSAGRRAASTSSPPPGMPDRHR